MDPGPPSDGEQHGWPRAPRAGRGALLATALATALLHGSPARADPPPRGEASPYPDGVLLTLRSEDAPLALDLYAPKAHVGKDLPVARCTTPCFARLPPGKYRLFVHATESTLRGTRWVELHAPTAVSVSPDHDSQRIAGLALGIAGPVLVFAGMIVALSGACWYGECGGKASEESAGIAMMLGGAAITPVGWIMFTRSLHPDLTVTPLGGSGVGAGLGAPPRVRWAGATLGATFHF